MIRALALRISKEVMVMKNFRLDKVKEVDVLPVMEQDILRK